MERYLRRTDIVIKWLCIGILVYTVSTIISLITLNGTSSGAALLLSVSTAIFDIVSLIIFLFGIVYALTGIIVIFHSVQVKKRLNGNKGYHLIIKGILLIVFVYVLVLVYNSVTKPFDLTVSLQRTIHIL